MTVRFTRHDKPMLSHFGQQVAIHRSVWIATTTRSWGIGEVEDQIDAARIELIVDGNRLCSESGVIMLLEPAKTRTFVVKNTSQYLPARGRIHFGEKWEWVELGPGQQEVITPDKPLQAVHIELFPTGARRWVRLWGRPEWES